MVKELSNFKNKKLHSSKPYDVSNSFVKKVASSVTNLLPQPAWLSKWFTSSVETEVQERDVVNLNNSGSEDHDNVKVHTSPRKPAKIPLNQQFPPDSFKISPVFNDQVSSQQGGASGIIHDDIYKDEAVAGPSGINTRHLVSSTPNIQSTATHLLAGTDRKMNGDDQSESSESTSGCSSLVPQANRQYQAGGRVINSSSGRRRSMDEKLSFTGHLQSPRTLFSDRSHSRSPRLTPYANRKRPSFNVSSFASPFQGKDKSAVESCVTSSPFYAGRTMYGGASAYRTKDRSFVHCEVVSQKRGGVQVKPVNFASDSLSSMSTTARRILEALEQFSTPVLDAKRIPLKSSTPPLSLKHKRIYDSGLRPSQAPHTSKSACGLTIPTVPDLLKMKCREKLQDSLESARLIAVTSYPSNFNQEYRLRFEDGEQSGKHVGKIRGKEKELEEETVAAVNLPNISLPLTSLPKFDFIVPPASSTPKVTCTFKFASPITVTENARTSLPTDTFTFSKPISAVGNKNTTMSREMNGVGTFIPDFAPKLGAMQFMSGSDNKSVSSDAGVSCNNSQSSDVCFGTKAATELKAGSVMDILGKKPISIDKEELKEVTSSSSVSLDKFKPAPGTWECGLCMIRNKSDAMRCIACETPRTFVGSVSFNMAATSACPEIQSSASEDMWDCSSCHEHNPCCVAMCGKCLVARTGQSLSQAKEPDKPAVSISGFGNKFKPASDTWECSTCLVRNPGSSNFCQACETQGPVLTTKSSPKVGFGFGDRFKKPPGAWNCPDCMVQNSADSLNCVACKKAKPGSEPESTVKFNFGIDKANFSVKESDIYSSSNMQGFKFGETKVTAASGFSFGVTQNCETKGLVLGSTSSSSSSSPLSTTGVLFGDGFKKSPGTWNCPVCMIQINNDSLKCVQCEKMRPDSSSQSAIKFSFGIDKAGVSLKESDIACSSKMQGFKFGETKVTVASDIVPRIPDSDISTVVTTGFSFGNSASPLSVVKTAGTSSHSQTEFSFRVPHPEFQSQASDGDKPSGGMPKKCRSSDTVEVTVNSDGDAHTNSGLSREPATSNCTQQIQDNSDSKDHGTKRVTFSFGAAGGTSEKPNTATKTVEFAKPTFSFPVSTVGTASTDFSLSSVKPVVSTIPSFSFTSSQASFGSSTATPVTVSSIGASTDVLTSNVTSAASSNLFSFGSPKSCVTFGGSSQQLANTSGSVPTCDSALKATASPAAFNFIPNINNKESVGATTSSFASLASTGSKATFGTSLKTTAASSNFNFIAEFNKARPVVTVPNFVSVTSAATVTAFGPLTTTITSSSLPNFNSATTSNFGFAARSTFPVFGTPSISTACTTILTSSSSSITSAPLFSTGFASLNEQKPSLPAVSNSATKPVPFPFASAGQTFSFGSPQNDKGFASNGAFSFGATSPPGANSGFQFVSNNQSAPQVGPTFSFGSNVVTTSNATIPSFGTQPVCAPVFGAAASIFGSSNPGTNSTTITSAAAPAPAPTVTPATSTQFKFGSSISQPSSNLFGFPASQVTGLTNVGVSNLTSPTNFNFNQAQVAAQPSAQTAAPTFDPSVRPIFNFTKGETPSFTAAGTPGSVRRFKKALRRTHPR